ncbi:carbohydrate ABC transporter substrate-binding protein [Vibrio sp. JPW-9-11-11]|uniref:ABC transporter substrate-binding protein n=1 Tax=Vibrio sp. JPW-9-11-11 TaxID=1416532 RepID=UPI00159384AD|nr:ABC transporter substrate-binding protein [Vibrio sp. JPW-9-11-11]NVD08793.1 carbohydrate ABC transporter substrate-binding protein [Vibrio sp. JPW-9-11-11]
MNKLVSFLSLSLFSLSSHANVEFLHWWTSDGEQAALAVLEQQLQQHNINISASPVIGGGGDSAMTVLQARALAGNPPSFAQIEGPSIKAWDAIGILYHVNEVAEKHHWDQVLYPLSIDINKTDNGYVALPLTLHRLNWLWVNHQLLNQLNQSVPDTWQEMLAIMELAKAHGINPLAVGQQPWQIAMLFENLVISTGGVDFYNKAMVELQTESIDSEQLRFAFNQLRQISLLVDNTGPDAKWDSATRALAANQALFQLGGDWILAELMANEVEVPNHIGCYPTPESDGVFLYNMDSLIFMASKSFDANQANRAADVLADKSFQKEFNRVKGSIPARKDIDIQDFNPCQVRSYRDFHSGINTGKTVPSMIDSMAVNPVAQKAINSEIFRFYRDKSIEADTVIKRIIAIAGSN